MQSVSISPVSSSIVNINTFAGTNVGGTFIGSATSALNLMGNLITNAVTITPTQLSYISGATSNLQNQINTLAGVNMGSYALLASPIFTGIPTAPTAISTTNSTQIATCAYVQSQNYLIASALNPYALTSSLSTYATTSSLSSYATTASLSSYALISSLSTYALSANPIFSGTITTPNSIFSVSVK